MTQVLQSKIHKISRKRRICPGNDTIASHKTASEKLFDRKNEKQALEVQQLRIEKKAMEAQARFRKALIHQEGLGLRSSSTKVLVKPTEASSARPLL